MATALFAGGCFWCVEHDVRALPGVTDALSGFTGGESTNPTYENHEGHKEAVEVSYNETKTSFKKLSQFFLDNIDPTDGGGQFYDRGEAYKTAIFYKNDDEKKIAEDLIKELGDSGIYDKPIVVQVMPESPFYKAEEYHQRYAEKNAAHYEMYAAGSGRKDLQKKVCEIREEKHINWKD